MNPGRHPERLEGLLRVAIVLIACALTTLRAVAQPAGTPPSPPVTDLTAQAQSAERPIWKVGYKWTFHAVSGLPQQESDWSREVIKLWPEGEFLVRTNTGETLRFDGETNSLDRRGPDFSRKRFNFPLFVGKQWTHKRRIGDTAKGSDGYETSSWEVKALEKLTVPAGTFDCFRVEGTVWGEHNVSPYSPSLSRNVVTYWYCPAVKWFAKLRQHTQSSQYSPMYVDSDSELTSFSGD